MEDEKIDEEEIWSAIRYLDPDAKKAMNRAEIIGILALLLMLGAVWALFHFRL
jgi:hypothetical protein